MPSSTAFYSGLGLEIWRAAVTPEETQAEVDFLMEALEAEEGDRLLDAPCGYGRHALEAARRGCSVTGVDLVEDFLAEAALTARRESLDADFLVEDLREMSFEPVFDGVYCLGNSFGIFDQAGTQRFLEGVASALVPGGRFLLESGLLAESLLPNYEERLWRPVGDLLLLMENSYDALEGRLDTTYTVIQDGLQESREASHWIFTLAELRALLESTGLETVGFCADLDGAPFELGSDRIFLVAEKQG